ncbi:MAG: phosphate propanoyltransferase [Eubacterium sp.]|nr:phosphate propanoyltransferase [Eubacterium sp.]
MDQQHLNWKIRTEALLVIKEQTGKLFVPIGVSNRHVHLCQEDLEALFGPGYQLTPIKPLSQPDQFASQETVTVVGPKGKIEKMRVLGPLRPQTQIEISITDSFALGIKPSIRMSGKLADTPGAKIIGPAGEVDVKEGVMVAARHMHISKREAEVYGLKDGQTVGLKVPGERALVFENVLVRSGDGHELEVHLDVDEANAAKLKNNDILEIIV